MSRVHVPALLAVVFVLVAVPAALAARAPSPTTHSPAPGAVAAAHHAHRRPVRSVFVRARRSALAESRRAHAYADRIGARARSSREIWHARNVRYLVWLRHVWARRAAGYLRVLRVRMRGVHAARAAMREVGVPYEWGMSSPGSRVRLLGARQVGLLHRGHPPAADDMGDDGRRTAGEPGRDQAGRPGVLLRRRPCRDLRGARDRRPCTACRDGRLAVAAEQLGDHRDPPRPRGVTSWMGDAGPSSSGGPDPSIALR